MRCLEFSSFALLIGLSTYYPDATEGMSYSVWQRVSESHCGAKLERPKECDPTRAAWVCQAIIDKLEEKVYVGYACISNTYDFVQKKYAFSKPPADPKDQTPVPVTEQNTEITVTTPVPDMSSTPTQKT